LEKQYELMYQQSVMSLAAGIFRGK
jgi:hypothetical protein